jgi:lipopolysaccharide export system permease protein
MQFMRVRIIPLYIFRRFCVNLLFFTAAILAIYIIIDYVGKIKRFADIPLTTFAFYYFFVFPYIINLFFSIIILLTAMFTMGGLAKNSEITAMRSAGFSIFAISRPVVYFTLLLVLGNIAFNETLMPRLNRVRERMYKTLIRRQPPQSQVGRDNFFYIGKRDVIFHFKGRYDARAKAGQNVEIQFYEEGRLVKRITCERLAWRDNGWEAQRGVMWTFGRESIVSREFKVLRAFPKAIAEKPDDILKERLLPDEMNFMELNRYIENLKRTGQADPLKIKALRADLQFKISHPFISFIVVMFGVSLTVRVGRSGMAKVFGLGLLTGFIYYFLVQLGLGLGRSGVMHPVLGAWLGNIIFFPLSAGYFYKVSKLE